MSINAVRRAIDHAGGVTALARKLDVSPPTVAQWASNTRPVPAERCPQIDRATSGAVRCEELRPDIEWAVLRKAATPAVEPSQDRAA
jgi:DNA-binding transcriptional regulator YdaS (Cro superfamily)